jgi:hypothetical protein
VGIVSIPGHFYLSLQESLLQLKILGARGKEATKGLLPTLTPQPTSSDYRSVKIEICMIAMMNMGMALAQ